MDFNYGRSYFNEMFVALPITTINGQNTNGKSISIFVGTPFMLDVSEQKANQALKALVAMLGRKQKSVVCLLQVTSSKTGKHKLSFTNHIINWVFFCVNNGTPIELINTQVTCCYHVAIGPSILVQRTQCQKGSIMQFKVNGIMAMKKHIDVDTCQSNSKNFWPWFQQYWKLFYKSCQCTSLSVWMHEVCRRILCLFYGEFGFKLKEIWEFICVIWVGLCYQNQEIHINRKNQNVIN